MAAVLTGLGKDVLLEKVINIKASSDLVLHLFSNNIIPKQKDTLDRYKEVENGGYVPIVLWGGEWEEKELVAHSFFIEKRVFIFNDKIGNVYGYYITSGNSKLIWAERFTDGPYKVNKRDKIEIKLNLSIKERK